MEGRETIVIDNGSFTLKVGVAGEDAPKLQYPVGNIIPSDSYSVDWDRIETKWSSSFQDLNLKNSEDKGIVMSGFHGIDDLSFKKICEICLEKFAAPIFSYVDSSVLSLYSSGRTTGVVLESGEAMTKSVCIYESLPIPRTLMKMERCTGRNRDAYIAGGKVLSYFESLLHGDGEYTTRTHHQHQKNRKFLEFAGYVSLDYSKELENKSGETREYRTEVDGTMKKMNLGTEQFRATEILFQPSLANSSLVGFDDLLPVHQLVNQSIQNLNTKGTERSTIRDMFRNIVLSGGNTKFEGFTERLSFEIESLHPKERVGVIAPCERHHSVWIGGSIFASLMSWEKNCVKKEDYDEYGGESYKLMKAGCPYAIFEKGIGFGGVVKDLDVDERLQYSEEMESSSLKRKRIKLWNLEIEISSIHTLVCSFLNQKRFV